MGKQAFRYVAYGECPKCDAQIIRPYDCTLGICNCKNPAVRVPLKPAILFRTNSRLYRKIDKIAKMVNVSVDEFVNALLDKGIRALDRGEITVKELRGVE